MDSALLCFILTVIGLVWILRMSKQHKEEEAQYNANISSIQAEKARLLQQLNDANGINRYLVNSSVAKAEVAEVRAQNEIYVLNTEIDSFKKQLKREKEQFEQELAILKKYKIYHAQKKNEDFSIPNEIFVIATSYNDAVCVIRNQVFENNSYMTTDIIRSSYEIALVSKDKSRVLSVDYDIM